MKISVNVKQSNFENRIGYINRLCVMHCFNHNTYKDCFVKNNEDNNVCFQGGQKVIKDVMHSHVYEEFLQQYRKIYGNIPLEYTVRKIFKTNNPLNQGSQKRVYIFPKLEDYVVAHMYKKEPLSSIAPIKKAQIKFPRYNFGEPFATNNYDILIMKRVKGVEHSVSNQTQASHYICQHGCATRQMAEEYLSKLEMIKDFPQSAYDDLLEQIEYLSEKGQFVDFINSNNLLLDTVAKKFHILDLLPEEANVLIKSAVVRHSTKAKTSSIYDAIHLLLAPRFQCYFMDCMNQAEKDNVINISKKIIKHLAESKSGKKLAKEDDLIRIIVKFDVDAVETSFNENFYNRYDECLSIYKDVLSKI